MFGLLEFAFMKWLFDNNWRWLWDKIVDTFWLFKHSKNEIKRSFFAIFRSNVYNRQKYTPYSDNIPSFSLHSVEVDLNEEIKDSLSNVENS